MKSKSILLTFLFLFSIVNIQAQLIEKLKQRANEKGIKTNKEVKYDSTAYDPNMDMGDEDFEELVINSPEEFFNKDVVMALYDNKGGLVQTSYFDKETIAMRTDSKANAKPIYHDRKGKFYAYDDEEGQYKSMALLPGSSMGFMTSGMTTQLYKLPPTPYFQAFEALSKLDIAMNFLILEMTFVYKPKHFENNNWYKFSSIDCGGGTCAKFSYTDPEYAGSYIVFDARERLRELNIVSSNPQFKDNPAGKFVFSYKRVTVELPDAEEQPLIPGELGKMIDINKSLEPWKHNKKHKKKEKNN